MGVKKKRPNKKSPLIGSPDQGRETAPDGHFKCVICKEILAMSAYEYEDYCCSCAETFEAGI